MNLKKIREVINQARASNPHESCQKLADSFEVFIELYSQKDEMGSSPEFLERLERSQFQFWKTFIQTAKELGFTPETLKEHFENPANFSPSYWQNLQVLKRETSEEPEQAPVRKLKNNNKKVRI